MVSANPDSTESVDELQITRSTRTTGVHLRRFADGLHACSDGKSSREVPSHLHRRRFEGVYLTHDKDAPAETQQGSCNRWEAYLCRREALCCGDISAQSWRSTASPRWRKSCLQPLDPNYILTLCESGESYLLPGVQPTPTAFPTIADPGPAISYSPDGVAIVHILGDGVESDTPQTCSRT